MVMSNEHIPTPDLRQRVSDLVMAGTPKYIIAEIIDIDDETLSKHYAKEIKTSKSIAIERIAKTVYAQACEGDSKAQALYLKTQGNDHGWVEKQVIENVNADETKELREQVKALEEKYAREY